MSDVWKGHLADTNRKMTKKKNLLICVLKLKWERAIIWSYVPNHVLVCMREQDQISPVQSWSESVWVSVECVAEHEAVRWNLLPTVLRKYLGIPRLTNVVCLAGGQVFVCACECGGHLVTVHCKQTGSETVFTKCPRLTSYQGCPISHNTLREVKATYIQEVQPV